jgi:DNA primase
MKTHDVKSVDGKVKIAKEGVALLGKIPDKVRRDFYTKALAESLDVKESFLYEILRSSLKEPSKTRGDVGTSSTERSFPRSEEWVVHLMARYPEVIPAISKEDVLKEFESPILQKIAEALEDLYRRRGKFNLPQALAHMDEDLRGRLSEFAFQEDGLEGGDREKILQDCVQKIREKRIKREKGELLKRIKEAEKQQEGKRLVPLLKERQELAKREKGLQKDGFRRR